MKARTFALTLALLCAAGAAHADRARAVTLYHAGEAAFAKNDFKTAATSFEAAYKEEPHGASVYNAALSWESVGDLARAADDFDLSLKASDLPANLATTAREHLAKLDPKIGRVHVEGAAGTKVQIGSLDAAPVPTDVRLAPGHYTIHATTSGGAVDRDVDVAAGAQVRVDIAPPVVTPTAPPPVQAPLPPVTEEKPSAPLTGIIGKPTLAVGVALTSVAVGLTAVTIGLGVATLNAASDYQASGYHDQALHDQAVSLRLATNVVLVSAIVTGALGIGALLTVHKQKTEITFLPGLVTGRF